ncbi:MAG: hypothetical protein IKT00_11080 [Prevotella sp.]|nr:hypothetical protein [Prevotella sp.]
MALAFGKPNFTPPHVVRAMRINLGFLPALWAEKGDVVIVDDVDYALKAAHKAGRLEEKVLFVTVSEAARMAAESDPGLVDIQPWGWDEAVRKQLERACFPQSSLPDHIQMTLIRNWSNRKTGVALLGNVRKFIPETVGESVICTSVDEVADMCSKYHNAVVKAPWSCSGRGIRYVLGRFEGGMERWLSNIIDQQGAVTIEPLYHKVLDFGMEFSALGDGTIRYEGLSVFHTENGAYIGNVITTERRKMERIVKYIPSELLETVKITLQNELATLFKGKYVGPLGVDMMVVLDEGRFLLHPLVEMNLRRTMGHLALAWNASPIEPERIVRVRDGVNFELHVKPIENAFVKVL